MKCNQGVSKRYYLINNRGAITLYVLIAVLFFFIVLVGIYTMSSKKQTMQVASEKQMAKTYQEGNNEITQVYEQVKAESNGCYVTQEEVLQMIQQAFAQKNYDEKIQQVAMNDTGWKQLTLTSAFNAYEGNMENNPEYRKVGNIVQIRGAVSPTAKLEANAWANKITTLPAEIIPDKKLYTICQGSNRDIWMLNINTLGEVNCARYGNGVFTQADVNTWMPFQITYIVD